MEGTDESGRGRTENTVLLVEAVPGKKQIEDTAMNELQLEQAVQAWGKDVLRFCRITAGSAEEGDELYQDTMLTLLEKREFLDASQNSKSYALSVAMKLWKNRTRKWIRRFQLVPQESLESLTEQGIQPGGVESPEEYLMRKVQVQMVRDLVQQLPDAYRLPLQLYYAAGLTAPAVAEVLKIPENTVKTRLNRAKKRIRTKLEEMEYERTGI